MARRTHNVPEIGEVLFEFITQGNYVKVIAVDTATNTEISMVGDRRSRKATLQNTAINKLRYVIRKKAGIIPNQPSEDENLYWVILKIEFKIYFFELFPRPIVLANSDLCLA